MHSQTTKRMLKKSEEWRLTELLSAFQKSEGREPYVEEEEFNSIKESGAHLFLQVDMAARKLVQTIWAIFPLFLCSRRLSFLRTKESGLLLTPLLRTEELCRYKYRNWLQIWYVITFKKNENKMDHIIGTPWDRYWWRRLLDMERRNSQTIIGFVWFMKAAVWEELNFVDHKNSLCYFRPIQGHSGGISRKPELMGCTSILYVWKVFLSQRLFVKRSIYLGEWIDSGGKENDKARQAVLFTLLNLFGEHPGEEKPHDKYKTPQKLHNHNCWKRKQDAVCWIQLSRAPDEITCNRRAHSCARVHCIHRVVSENGDRVMFDSRATPRPAPKVTLKINWLVQQLR